MDKADKKTSIVQAATRLFSHYGFKRTSLDLLATEAGVAKPTIYAYFQDKEAIFRAVVEAVGHEILSGANFARDLDGTLEERVAMMLSAKLTRYFELVEASPHAHELIDSQSRLGEEIVERLDRAFVKLLAGVLDTRELHLTRHGLTPTSAAQLFVRAASGAAYDATSATMHRRSVKEIVALLIAGLRS